MRPGNYDQLLHLKRISQRSQFAGDLRARTDDGVAPELVNLDLLSSAVGSQRNFGGRRQCTQRTTIS